MIKFINNQINIKKISKINNYKKAKKILLKIIKINYN